MITIPVPLVGEATRRRHLKLSPEILVNLFPETHPGKTSDVSLSGTPGLKLFVDLTDKLRLMHTMVEQFYALAGTTFYSVNSSGVGTAITGSVPGTTRPKADDNGTQIAMPIGNGYVFDSSTNDVTQITDGDYNLSSSCCFVGQYLDFVEDNSGKHFLSDFANAKSYDALQFATAESVPDNLIANHQFLGDDWLYGTRSTERWYVSGESFPLNPYNDGKWNIGLGARLSVASNTYVICWLGHDRRVYLSAGGKPEVISTSAIEYAIRQMTSVGDATGYIYSEEEHTFYVLNFTVGNRTFVYDLTIKWWHERSSNGGRFLGDFYANIYGKHLVGSYSDGKIYEMSLDFVDESGNYRIHEGITPAVQVDGGEIQDASLEILLETGITPLNENENQIEIRWSDDGHQWSNWVQRSIGAQGKRKTKVIIDGIGSFEERFFHYRLNPKAPVSILKAWVTGNVGTRH